ncbi:MAG: nuclear transport factor 2 family protein [Acidimicrobiaceae bacterium]|nr:nuclear transport factor 2 family protein [Acidimicrobiaceae bacterium]
MTTQQSLERLGETVRLALEAADLDAFAHLLAPDASWGPVDDPASGCHTRDDVLVWYRQRRARGVRAHVDEVLTGNGSILVGLTIARPGADEVAGPERRWQVLTVRDGLVVDIRGYEDRSEAVARAGIHD